MKINSTHKVQANQRVWSIDWHPQGQILVSAGSTKNVILWKYQKQQLTKTQTITTQHTKTIRCVKFSHKGDKIAVGSFDSTISVWVFNNQNKQFQLLSTLQGHQNQVKCLSWSRNDQKIASCSRDKNIWVWDFDTISYDYVCDAVLQGHTQDVKYVQWFPSQQRKLLSASYDNSIRIWQGQDDDYICKQVLQAHQSIVWSVKISQPYLFSASEDCTIMQWKLNKQSQKYQLSHIYQAIHSLPIYTLQIFNKNILLTGSADNSISMFQFFIETKNKDNNFVEQKRTKPEIIDKVFHQSDVNCLKINPKFGNLLASCSDDETLHLWKIQ